MGFTVLYLPPSVWKEGAKAAEALQRSFRKARDSLARQGGMMSFPDPREDLESRSPNLGPYATTKGTLGTPIKGSTFWILPGVWVQVFGFRVWVWGLTVHDKYSESIITMKALDKLRMKGPSRAR